VFNNDSYDAVVQSNNKYDVSPSADVIEIYRAVKFFVPAIYYNLTLTVYKVRALLTV
jgi:hypothetical protein